MADETTRGLSASECPACWEELGDRRIPYSLTCGHTLCIICIKRLCLNSPQFHCPLCREIVPLNSVKRNVTLYQLLNQLKGKLGQGSYNPALTTSFDSIKLEQLLDRGASGEVHRGLWQENEVAVKIFASGQVSPEIQESFRREVCVMNSLRHPNVVLLMAACPNPPRLAIIMEYVGGGSLYSHLYITKTALVLQDSVRLLIDIGRGLQYLHSINILHRDLKSKNVLLTGVPPHCQAKLCDFGLARMRLESATMTGNIGTVHWTAPEVLNCARYHFSADVYSLGMVMYELIARSIPYAGLPPPAVIVAVLFRREKPRIPPGADETLSSLATRCLSWEPEDRPSVSSILHELQSLVTPPPQSDPDPTFSFNHVDSLGNVEVELEFDETDMDSDLMEFLQAAQGDGVEIVEGVSGDNERDEDEEEEGKEGKSAIKDFDSPLFLPVGKGGVLSDRELQELPSSLTRSSYIMSPMNSQMSELLEKKHAKMAEMGRLTFGGPAASQAGMIDFPYHQYHHGPPTTEYMDSTTRSPFKKKQGLAKKDQTVSTKVEPVPRGQSSPDQSSQRVMPPLSRKYMKAGPPRYMDSSDYTPSYEAVQQFHQHQNRERMEKYRLESGGLMDWAESIDENRRNNRRPNRDLIGGVEARTLQKSMSSGSHSTEEDDLELAMVLQLEEEQKQLKSDFELASRLQKEYSDSNVPAIAKPPPVPAPPPSLPLNQLPFRPTSHQLLLKQVSTLGRMRKLRPVQTVEKRGVKMGRVIDGISNEDHVYTLQSEVQAFNKKLLFKVAFKEPDPVYPVGRVLPDQTEPFVKRMVAKINTQIRLYDKKYLRHVSFIEKSILPTAEEIKSEKLFASRSFSEPSFNDTNSSEAKDPEKTRYSCPEELEYTDKEVTESNQTGLPYKTQDENISKSYGLENENEEFDQSKEARLSPELNFSVSKAHEQTRKNLPVETDYVDKEASSSQSEASTEAPVGKKGKSGGMATKKEGFGQSKEDKKKPTSGFSVSKASLKTVKGFAPVSPTKTTVSPSHSKTFQFKSPSKSSSIPKGASTPLKTSGKMAPDLHCQETVEDSHPKEPSLLKMKQSRKKKK